MGRVTTTLSLGLGSNSGDMSSPISSEKQIIYDGPTTRTKGNFAKIRQMRTLEGRFLQCEWFGDVERFIILFGGHQDEVTGESYACWYFWDWEFYVFVLEFFLAGIIGKNKALLFTGYCDDALEAAIFAEGFIYGEIRNLWIDFNVPWWLRAHTSWGRHP